MLDYFALFLLFFVVIVLFYGIIAIHGGLFGQVAIYSDHASHVAVMRKVLLRMSAWMNYTFPFH